MPEPDLGQAHTTGQRYGAVPGVDNTNTDTTTSAGKAKAVKKKGKVAAGQKRAGAVYSGYDRNSSQR